MARKEMGSPESGEGDIKERIDSILRSTIEKAQKEYDEEFDKGGMTPDQYHDGSLKVFKDEKEVRELLEKEGVDTHGMIIEVGREYPSYERPDVPPGIPQSIIIKISKGDSIIFNGSWSDT